MTRRSGPRKPPTGVGRVLLRLPILFYRVHLGWLLGRRFVLVEHVGRRSGRLRRTVVEVVDHRLSDDSYVVASGFGTTAQWYRNLVAHPRAAIQVGRRRHTVDAVPIPAAEGGNIMAEYAQRHPLAARGLCRLLGLPVDGGDYRTVGERIPFLRLHPVIPRT